MTRPSARCHLAVSLLALALACAPPDSVEETSQAILKGTATRARPAIGRLTGPAGSCTATLIHPLFILTAAHCVGFSDANASSYKFWIDRASGDTVSFTGYLIETLAYSHIGSPTTSMLALFKTPDEKGNPDLAVIRLSSAVPAADATPIRLLRTLPADGTRATLIGYGCTESLNETGAGTKRFGSFNYVYRDTQNQAVGCSGDSGGPGVTGELADNGNIWGVYSASSSVDFFAHAPWFYDSILRAMMSMSFVNVSDPAPAMSGVGLDGILKRSFSGATVDCQNACLADGQGCEGWSLAGGTCKIWSTVREWFPDPSSSARPRQNYENFTNRPGGDIGGWYLSQTGTSGREACRGMCARNASCASYTFVDAGIQDPTNSVCWLKNGVPTASATSLAIHSGVRRGLRAGVAIGGRLFSNTTAATAAACSQTCVLDGRCKAFTWTPPSTCVLRAEVGSLTADAASTSGIRGGLEVATNRQGLDLPGMPIEYTSFETPPGPERCQIDCEKNSSCQSFTYVAREGISPNLVNARCWLKGGVPIPVSAGGNVVSGVKGGAFF